MTENFDYKYLVCGTYHIKETAYAFNSLNDAKHKLFELNSYDNFIWELHEKSTGGKAFKQICRFDDIKKEIYDYINPYEGLHSNWLLENKIVEMAE